MFSNVELLSYNKHQELRLGAVADFKFAEKITAAPLGISEILPASRHYPIVFPASGAAAPMALLSLQKDHNNFVDAEGRWKVPYIPAHFRRYPFILAKGKVDEAETEVKEEKYHVCIDAEAPHFKMEMGDPLFAANEEPAEVTRKVIELLQNLQKEIKVSEEFSEKLAQQGCFSLKQINQQIEGEAKTLGEFRVVDSSRVKELTDEVILEWARGGLLPLLYAMDFSLTNLEQLGKQEKYSKSGHFSG